MAKQLHNKVDKRLLKERMEQDRTPRTTLSFYCYAHISDPQAFRDYLYEQLSDIGAMGRIYVAKEGINAQINVPDEQWNNFVDLLESIDFMNGVHLNIAVDEHAKSFFKLKILVKDKIVADGLADETFDVTKKGTHVDAKRFNELLDDPDTVCVDMRNHYEAEVGHFENAITPDVDTFRESLPIIERMLGDKQDAKLLMYCTGGIRCEKASAYFKHKGFEKVFQLKGGIIEYARQVEENELPNKFRGKNFVFDERLGERISPEIIARCHQCGKAADTHINCRNEACHILFIQCDECAARYDSCCSDQCKDFIALPEEEQKRLRKGFVKPHNVFRKGRINFRTFGQFLSERQESRS